MKPHQANTLTLVCLVLLAGTPALAGRTVAYPNAIDATLQAAMDRAGCGGTVKLAPGTYSERAQFPNPSQATVSSSCRGLRLIGAGVDRTFIDGAGLSDPVGTPVIAFGFHPFAVFPLTGPYELAHLTIYTDDPLGTTLHGFGTGWTRDTSVHHVRIAGFLRGILMSLANDTSISHATVQCPGVDPADFGRFTRGIAFSTNSQLRHHLPGGHQARNSVHHTVVEDCTRGIELIDNVEARVHHNLVRRVSVGVNLFGVGSSVISHNVIADADFPTDPPSSGIDPSNVNDSAIHHNTICRSSVGIQFVFSSAPEQAFGFPKSSDNEVHHNRFSQTGQDVAFSDPDDPGVEDRNRVFANVNDPNLDCAAE